MPRDVRALVAEIEPVIDELAERMAREIHAVIPEVERSPGPFTDSSICEVWTGCPPDRVDHARRFVAHENTVTYRLRRAEELIAALALAAAMRGRRVDEVGASRS